MLILSREEKESGNIGWYKQRRREERAKAIAHACILTMEEHLLLLIPLPYSCLMSIPPAVLRKPKTKAEAGKYTLTIQPGVDAAFITALAMICENVKGGKAT